MLKRYVVYKESHTADEESGTSIIGGVHSTQADSGGGIYGGK